MATHILLLRGINVAGKRKLPMAELRRLIEDLGATGVRTYIQSGNVICEAPAAKAKALGPALSAAIADGYGYDVPVTVRAQKDLTELVATTPFIGAHADRDEDERRLAVAFLSAAPSRSAVAELSKFDARGDEAIVRGRHVLLFCPSTFAKTKLTNDLIERKLGCGSTIRNWRTVNKLIALCQ